MKLVFLGKPKLASHGKPRSGFPKKLRLGFRKGDTKPDDSEIKKTIAKSTRTSVAIRPAERAERDATRASLQATMKVDHHIFTGIARHTGRIIQRTSISAYNKERLNFS